MINNSNPYFKPIQWILIYWFGVGPIHLHARVTLLNAEQDLHQIVESAQPYDSLILSQGIYTFENILIDKPLTLMGQEGALLKSLNGDEILLVTADSVTIQGLTFTGVKTSYIKERSAIRIDKGKYFEIKDNVITNCFFGIYLEHVSHGVIYNNRISGQATTEAGSGNAIHAWYCSNIQIKGNELKGHRDGIYFEFVDKSLIEENLSFNNIRYGLHFMFSNDDIYRKNTFRDNGSGVAVMFSKEIKMIENTFSHNWGGASYGLLLKEINDASIINNQFNQNTIGIFVEGSNRITYSNNSFRRNGWAIKFSGGCSANEITNNNFLNNSLDLVVGTKLSDNEIHHNYWSEYTGYDLDKNNIGDVPHYPVKLFSYILNQVPEAIVLMRSFFVYIVNFSEKVSPVFTPKEVFDPTPLMHEVQ